MSSSRGEAHGARTTVAGEAHLLDSRHSRKQRHNACPSASSFALVDGRVAPSQTSTLTSVSSPVKILRSGSNGPRGKSTPKNPATPSSNFRPSIHLAQGALALAGVAAPRAPRPVPRALRPTPHASAQNECTTAIPITAGEPTAFSTSAATASANPPSNALCPGTALDWANSADVWFRWIAPALIAASRSTETPPRVSCSMAFISSVAPQTSVA